MFHCVPYEDKMQGQSVRSTVRQTFGQRADLVHHFNSQFPPLLTRISLHAIKKKDLVRSNMTIHIKFLYTGFSIILFTHVLYIQ